MKISRSKEKEFQTVDTVIRTSSQGVGFVERNANQLNMGNEPEEEERAEVDPSFFLSEIEAQAWDHLTPEEKKEYQEEGQLNPAEDCDLEKSNPWEDTETARGNWIAESAEQEIWMHPATLKTLGQKEADPELQEAYFEDPEAKYEWEKRAEWEQKKGQKEPIQQGEEAGDFLSYGTESGGETAVSQTAGTTSSQAAGAGAGAASSGASVALQAAKKTADSFKESLESNAAVTAQSLQKAQQHLQEIRSANQAVGTPAAMLKVAGTYIAAVFLVVANVIVQAATAIFGSLLSILVVVVVITTVIGALVGILAIALQEVGSGSPDQIVRVALQEEGTEDGSKYWKFTTGSEFVDGSTTPWCASFVTWCANECGYIEDGTFPKTASVATYRDFFREKERLHEAEDYVPKTGDLILFGDDEHIGIVQYTEGNRVVTIEGNTSDAVHSRSYTIGSSYITGYCSPEYPENADFSGDSYEEITYNFLRSKGCTKETAVAIMGNLKRESGIDPNRYQDGGGPGRGICQWEVGGRFEILKERAAQEGKEWTDIEVQLKFMWEELTGGDVTCQYILNRDYGGLENFLNATDIDWAVEAFEYSFERAGIPGMELRKQYAHEFYEQFA